jgi:hypothetical protein
MKAVGLSYGGHRPLQFVTLELPDLERVIHVVDGCKSDIVADRLDGDSKSAAVG